MNPVFWVIVIFLLVLVWFALVPGFRLIGKFISKMTKNANKTMFGEKGEEE